MYFTVQRSGRGRGVLANVKCSEVVLTEYTECWPCPLFDIFLNKYFPAG
jgi:hypothetical protein